MTSQQHTQHRHNSRNFNNKPTKEDIILLAISILFILVFGFLFFRGIYRWWKRSVILTSLNKAKKTILAEKTTFGAEKLKFWKKKIKPLEINFNVDDVGKTPIKNYLTDSGWDIFSDDTTYVIEPNQVVLVHTGLFIEIPEDYYFTLCSRSGLSLKHKIFVLNSPGILDAGYSGEICGIIANLDNKESFVLKPHTRFAQLVLNRCINFNWSKKTRINKIASNNTRSNKGFGSSGLK